MATDYPDAQPPGAIVGPLVLGETVAQGGEGIVYTARHARLGEVVVKEFWPKQIVSRARGATVRAAQDNWQAAYRDGVAQFMRLGQRLIDLPPHPGIMQALEVFEANNTAYLVTERISGRTLDAALDAGAFSDPAEIRELADKLSLAMAHLHEQGLFHRDLAPDNIIITAGYGWHPVLIDFNAAKDIVQKVSRSHDGIVKPGYTAIEQYAVDGKEPIGPWTDIYSASAVLYRCITGSAPSDPAIRLLRPGKAENLCASHSDRFDADFLNAIDSGLEPHPDNRPRRVEDWRKSMGFDRPAAEQAPLPEPQAPLPPPPPPPPSPPSPASQFASPQLGLLRQQDEQPKQRRGLPGWAILAGIAAAGLALAQSIWVGGNGQPGAPEAGSVVTDAATDLASEGAAATAAAVEPTAPKPLKPIATLVRQDDYPSAALANEEEGTAAFELAVGADGAPTSCRITASSRSAALDKATCAILQSRARFTPAHDASGTAVSGTFTGKLAWKLPVRIAATCNRGPYKVYFDFDSGTVKSDAAPVLDLALANWEKCGQPNVILVGYAGDAGSDAYARAFSGRRADSAKEYLTSRGMPQDLISTQSMGKNGVTGSGREARRVDIVFR